MNNELMDQFVGEARELLESSATAFLALEKDPSDADTMNVLFRVVHTLKGTSGIFDVAPLTQVVHAGEDVLDRVREGELSLTADDIDLFLDSLDQVSAWVDALEANGALPSDAAGESQQMATKLRALLMADKHAADSAVVAAQLVAVAASAAISVESENAPKDTTPLWLADMLADLSDETRARWHADLIQDAAAWTAIRYQPGAQCFFTGDDPINTAMHVPALYWHDVQPLEAWDSDADFDPYNCNLLIYMISKADAPEINQSLCYVESEVECFSLRADMLMSKTTDSEADQPASDHSASESHIHLEVERPAEMDLECAVSILRVQMEALSLPCEATMWAGRHASVTRVLKGLCGESAELHQAAQQAEQEHSFHPLLNWVEAVLQCWTGGGAAALDVAADIIQQDIKQPTQVVEEESVSKGKARKPSFLRVEQERIDQLMDLVGELVVAKNSLPFLSDRAEKEFGVKPLAREIKAQYEVVNRLSEEFQSIVMRIRMVSVSTVFQRFPRLVRDLSRRLEKNIELVIVGEDTEADKNVVEALSDPLIHLVRNSLDHGIEMPADRVSAGKPEHGTITLRAVQQEDQVLIEVIDDGKGLDPASLKQQAYEKGLIDEDRLDNISDKDALQLILMAGFSMAKEVSDLSGRGVGMDVVNSMVKQVGGSISLSSKLGEGTTVRLSLPLSMAVTRVMMVSVDRQRFGISIEQIVETVKIPASEIHHIKDGEAIVLRDRLIPLRCLRASLDMDSERADGEVSVLVVSTQQGLLGLVVDAFHAGLDIIQKPLDGVMAGFPLFTGTALLGDGSVLLILNLEALSCQ